MTASGTDASCEQRQQGVQRTYSDSIWSVSRSCSSDHDSQLQTPVTLIEASDENTEIRDLSYHAIGDVDQLLRLQASHSKELAVIEALENCFLDACIHLTAA